MTEHLARCPMIKYQSVEGIRRADFSPFIIRKKNIRILKKKKTSSYSSLLPEKPTVGANRSCMNESDVTARATDEHAHVHTTRLAAPSPKMRPSADQRRTSCFCHASK